MTKLVFFIISAVVLVVVVLAIGRGWILRGDDNDQSVWDRRMIAMGIPLMIYTGVALYFLFAQPG